MTKAEKRAKKQFKDRFGHFGAGSSHTREASESEVRRHIEKIQKNHRGKR